MKYAIISDIHSNLQALETALDVIDGERVDSIICLGDIIGYNANPIECLNIIRQHPLIKYIVMGNHDDMGARLPRLTYSEATELSLDAMTGLDFSYSQLSEDDKSWLLSKPSYMIVNDPNMSFCISHEAPQGREHNWGYILSQTDAWIGLKTLENKIKVKLGFFGHTHLPTMISNVKSNILDVDFDMGTHLIGEVCKLDLSYYHLINPGSIGQPRDDGITSFIIFDSDNRTVQFIQLEYDIKAAQEAIKKAKYCNAKVVPRLVRRLEPSPLKK